MAWKQIVEDKRLHDAMTTSQIADAEDKARTNRDSALKAVRAAWSHILYAVKSDTPGKPFELEHSLISSRDRAAIPTVVYDKARADGIALEKLGTARLWHALKPIWPDDRDHLPIAELTDWFSAYVYLPKLRDRVVLETSIRDAVAKLDPQFGYADGYDETSGKYRGLICARDPPQPFPATAMLVSDAAAKRQLAEKAAAGEPAPAGAPAAMTIPTCTSLYVTPPAATVGCTPTARRVRLSCATGLASYFSEARGTTFPEGKRQMPVALLGIFAGLTAGHRATLGPCKTILTSASGTHPDAQ
jgi:hypothetical protein